MRTVQANDPRPKLVQVAEDLRARIESGEFTPGAKLPSIIKLTDDYGVTQTTANEALKRLRAEGLAIATGRGHFVTEAQAVRAPTIDARLEAIEAEVRELRSRVASLESGQ